MRHGVNSANQPTNGWQVRNPEQIINFSILKTRIPRRRARHPARLSEMMKASSSAVATSASQNKLFMCVFVLGLVPGVLFWFFFPGAG